MYGDDEAVNRQYNHGSLRTGRFPSGWGETALREHVFSENVTAHGKAMAAQELAERAEQRQRDRSWF